MFLSKAINSIETKDAAEFSNSCNNNLFCFRVAEPPLRLTCRASDISVSLVSDRDGSWNNLLNFRNDTAYISTDSYRNRVEELERRVEELERITQRGGDDNVS